MESNCQDLREAKASILWSRNTLTTASHYSIEERSWKKKRNVLAGIMFYPKYNCTVLGVHRKNYHCKYDCQRSLTVKALEENG